ncbi:M3 family peptidase [bacterium]|nr:M3 family peptidase [bacterium]
MEDASRMSALSNPLLASSGLPDFAAILPKHVLPAVEQTVTQALEHLATIETQLQPTWAGTMGLIEDLERPFEYAWKPVGHLFGVHNSPELRTAYDIAMPKIVEFSLRVRQSEPLYKALVALKDGPEWDKLNGPQQRIIIDRIKDAELAGIGLPVEQRARFNEIEQELSKLGSEFSNHVLDATKAFSLDVTEARDAEGWPSSLRQLAAQAWNKANKEAATPATPETGPWRITLEVALFTPFMEHCRIRELREELYRAFVTRASSGQLDNTHLITKILALRKEKATLLGYPHFAAVSLMRKMAPSVDAIQAMFEQLRTASWQPAQQDLKDLEAIKTRRGDATPLALWDIAFWAERLREERYAYTDDEVRPYFPFERVLNGLFDLLSRLFNITVTQVTEGVSLWNSDVRFYHVNDASGEHLASFYLDPYSRPENKRPGAWMDDCLGRRRINGQLQKPIAHLVCNQTPPVGDKPALMTFREVETLFHEMGHGLQHMLTTIDYPDAAGISGVEWDAVELPSQFMENWCYHRPTLMGMTAHYQTGEPLPEALYEKICAAKNYRVASMMLRQLQFGMVDMELHTTFDPAGEETVFDVHRRIAERTSVLPPLPEDRFLCAFSHIFGGGYAAGYYSYKWAEILSADAFGAFEDAGLDDPAAVTATGLRFRNTVLSLGGSRHPLEVFREFRGRDPQVEPLLRHAGLLH